MAKRKALPPLTAAQLEIMNAVWRLGEATVGQVWETLTARRPLARNTVQTVMARLEEKGWLTHRTEGQTFYYAPAVPRQTTLRRMVRDLIETAFAGSPEGLVLALLEGRGVTKDEAERIRRIIDDAEGTRK